MNTDGYNIDVNYSYGYYRELSPLAFKISCLIRGIKPPKISSACELGYGNGISINVHSSASSVKWWGTDFNPSHANFANQFASVAENESKIYEDSFLDFLHQKDLPDFDFIGLHGIYSWVDKKNRGYLCDFIERKLRVGGGVYISYNVLPGFLELLPFRNVLKNYADFMLPESKSTISKLNDSLEFFEQLANVDATFIAKNEALKSQVQQMKDLDRSYLAHEFMNKSWEIMDFLQIHKELSRSKINFAFPAHFKSMWQHMIYTDSQKKLLDGIDNIYFQEYIKDLINNNRFRKDYWIKGAQPLSEAEQKKLLEEIRVVLIEPREKIDFSFELSAAGIGQTFNLQKELYGTFLDILSDYQPKTIAEIQQNANGKLDNFKQVIEVVTVLDIKGVLHYAQPDEEVSLAINKTHRLNFEILQKAKSKGEISVLASALLGEGIQVNRLEQLALLSILEGKKTSKEYIEFIWETLKSQNQKIIKKGEVIESEEDNIKEIEALVRDFEKKLPILKNLKILRGI
ncbi:class I SAM-dependent methyltransferase [Helicobacter cappadocius]|uniref:Methyltransferase regulatory domain-containing protein n=1 Tax=Helicobacter cappadocius TaxID=3063998 RepID=A0AA90PJE5_9HELI|nr:MULTISPECIES: methyltransferase regulatory domain-containing protein [unclassified Helicobacter]MDO7252432.1 methyltransferase regulatory domain-containing protein [Helicobacter sp. faydin-H75]MDP2538299.1 methyltransferase regulatory domain-containing protein [Helicobacter sp. faydin-H76]